MSRNQKTILILFVVLFAGLMFAIVSDNLDKSEIVVAEVQPTNHTSTAYLPLVMVNRGEPEVVVVAEDQVDDLVRVERPVRIERPVTDPCDSRNDPANNPDPHPCPARHSGQADEHSAPWPVPAPSPEQPKQQHQQQSQPTGGKHGG